MSDGAEDEGIGAAAQDGGMARRIRAHDWVATPLGPLDRWPQSLKTTVDIMLASPGMSSLVWGADALLLYNDAFTALLREHGGELLGRSAFEVFAGSRDVFEADIAAGMAGRSARLAAQRYPVRRDGRMQDAWFDVDYAPVRDEKGEVAGVLWTLREVTAQVLAEHALRESEIERGKAEAATRESVERQAFLLKLSDTLRAEPTADAVANRAIALLAEQMRLDRCYIAVNRPGQDRADIPYQVGDDRVRPLPDHIRPSDFPAALQVWTERTLVIDDTATAPGLTGDDRRNMGALGFRAVFSSAVRKGAGNPEWAIVGVSAQPRSWSPGEIALAEQVTERTWAAIERARAEAALRESERKYRALFESMDEAYAVVDVLKGEGGSWADFRFVDVNPAFLAHTSMPWPVGRTATELLGAPNPRWTELYGRALDTGEPIRVEESEPTLDRIFDLNIFPLDRARDRVTVLFTNITGRKRTAALLRDSEQRFRALSTAGGNSIYRMSPDWRVMYQLDSQTLAVTAEPIEDWVDKYIPAEDLPPVRAAIDKAIATKSLFELEHRVRQADGSIGWVLSRAVPLLGADGEIVEWFGAGSDVTDRRVATDALRESEERFRATFEQANVGIVEATLDGRILLANPGFRRMLGYDVEELHGRTVTDITHPDDLHLDMAQAGRVLAGEIGGYTIEKRYLRKDGSVVWGQMASSLVRDRAGAPAYALAVVQDISALKQAEIELRRANERFRLAEEAADGFVYDWRPREGLATRSEGFARVLGYAPGEVAETPAAWLDLIHPEDCEVPAASQAVQPVAGAGYAVEYRVRHKAGHYLWVLDRGLGVAEPDGGVRVVGSTVDLTDRKQAEAALRDSEERLRRFGEASQDILWIRNSETLQWTYLTPAFETIYGLSRAEVLKGDSFQNWLELIVPDDRARARENIDRVRAGEQVTFEYRIRRPSDGEVRWLRNTDFPIPDDKGRISLIGGVGQDVTSAKQGEQAQQVLVAELQHRTRNLIGVVRSMADKTARASRDLADFRERFGDRLEALARVQGLLSRLDTYDRVTFDDLVRTELAAMGGDPGRVTLEGPDGVRLRSSTVQTLAMALHELATNAVKYGALGQPSGRLAIRWSLDRAGGDGQPMLHIDWRERGVAMPPGPSPHGTGQGRELIERALPYQLRARTTYELGADGVRCTIAVPVSTSNEVSGASLGAGSG